MQLKPAVLQQQPQHLNRPQHLIQQWTLHISSIISNSYPKDMTNKPQQHMLNNMQQHTFNNKDNRIQFAIIAEIVS
jgi:hypothetical protein